MQGADQHEPFLGGEGAGRDEVLDQLVGALLDPGVDLTSARLAGLGLAHVEPPERGAEVLLEQRPVLGQHRHALLRPGTADERGAGGLGAASGLAGTGLLADGREHLAQLPRGAGELLHVPAELLLHLLPRGTAGAEPGHGQRDLRGQRRADGVGGAAVDAREQAGGEGSDHRPIQSVGGRRGKHPGAPRASETAGRRCRACAGPRAQRVCVGSPIQPTTSGARVSRS